MKRKLVNLLLVSAFIAFVPPMVGCDNDSQDSQNQSVKIGKIKQEPELKTVSEKKMTELPKTTKVKISTSKGDILVELNAEKAPLTVANFLEYVEEGFFSGTIFHRVIKGFMIQGGGMTPDGRQKPTKAPIRIESKNGLSNDRGTIAMARTSDPDSATSQFFINTVNNSFLNYGARDAGYTVFGKVVEGMDAVDAIEAVQTGPGDVPTETVTIDSITVVE